MIVVMIARITGAVSRLATANIPEVNIKNEVNAGKPIIRYRNEAIVVLISSSSNAINLPRPIL